MENQGIELKLVSRQRITESTGDPVAARRRADQETARQQALVYAHESLLAVVSVMRSSKDPSVILKAAKMIQDRAWGVPRSAEEEGQNEKNQSIIELLASMSANSALLTGQGQTVVDGKVAAGLLESPREPTAALRDLLVGPEDA